MGMTNTTTPAATECTTPSVLSVWFGGWTAMPCPCDVDALCGACGPATGYDSATSENLPSERLYASRCASIFARAVEAS